ncbi:MAG: carbohydrate-binding domain-containing protein, partial [Eubacterium sp.]|nr:carbohydrate-binding domain-containing protein [Eubacterium sp.]
KSSNVTISDGTINMNYTADDGIKDKGVTELADAADSNGTTWALEYTDDTGIVTISGGLITMTKTYGDGIQAHDFVMSGGQVNITTYYENAGLNYYNKSLSTYNTLTVQESQSSKTKTETVSVDTGGHKGIKAGNKAESWTYASVSDDSDYSTEYTYYTEASGGIEISGGTIVIDTTNTGVKYNSSSNSSSGNTTVAADSKVIIGAPEDGMKSQNDLTISGGAKLKINSVDDGISAAGTLTITGEETVVDIQQAFEGIEASVILVGEEDATTSTGPYVSVYSMDDGINASGYDSITTTYVDDDEEQYTEVKKSTSGSHSFTNYSGTVVVMIGDDASHSYSLYVTDGQGVVDDNSTVTGSYSADGDGIDCNGSLYIKGGTTVVWGPSSNDNDGLDADDNNIIYSGATVLVAGGSGMGGSPSLSGTYGVSYSSSVSSGTAFAVEDGSGSVLVAALAPKAVSSILFVSPDLTSGTSYSLYTGGTVSGLVNSNSSHDCRYSTYSGGTSSATATASSSASSGNNSGPGNNMPGRN